MVDMMVAVVEVVKMVVMVGVEMMVVDGCSGGGSMVVVEE